MSAQPERIAATTVREAPPPDLMVIEAVPGTELVIADEQPVLLKMNGSELLLRGSGLVAVDGVRAARVHVKRGVLRLRWRPRHRAALRIASVHGEVELVQGAAEVEVTDEALDWRLISGEAREIVSAPPPSKSPRVATPKGRSTPVAPTAPAAPAAPPVEGIADRSPPTADELYARAETAMLDGRQAEAITTLTALRELHPSSPSAELALMDLARLLATHEPAAAVALYERYLAEYPDGPMADEAHRQISRLGAN